MSNNHTIATVNTLIPLSSVTDFEIEMLKEHGFTQEKDSDKCHFYTDDFLLEEVDDYRMGQSTIEEALKIPENQVYFDENKKISYSHYADIFQNILRRCDELSVIEIEGAFTCSKIERNQFGGFAALVTKDDFIIKGTSQFLKEAYSELEDPSPILKETDRDGNSDYIMEVDGGSAWITVGPASIYITPGTEGVSINVFPRGKEAHNPLDSAHVSYAEINKLLDGKGDVDDEEDGPNMA